VTKLALITLATSLFLQLVAVPQSAAPNPNATQEKPKIELPDLDTVGRSSAKPPAFLFRLVKTIDSPVRSYFFKMLPGGASVALIDYAGGSVNIYSTASGSPTRTISAPKECQLSLATFSVDLKFLACRTGGATTIFDFGDGRKLGELKGTEPNEKLGDYFTPHRFVSDDTILVNRKFVGRVLSALQFWSVSERKLIGSIELDTADPALGVDCDYDGRYCVVMGRSGNITVYDVPSKKPLVLLQGHTAQVASEVISQDRLWLCSAGLDGTIRLWDLHNHNVIKTIPIPTTPLQFGKLAVDLSPDKQLLALVANAKAFIIDVASGQVVQVLSDYSSVAGFTFGAIGFSSEGNSIVATGSAAVHVYHRTTRE